MKLSENTLRRLLVFTGLAIIASFAVMGIEGQTSCPPGTDGCPCIEYDDNASESWGSSCTEEFTECFADTCVKGVRCEYRDARQQYPDGGDGYFCSAELGSSGYDVIQGHEMGDNYKKCNIGANNAVFFCNKGTTCESWVNTDSMCIIPMWEGPPDVAYADWGGDVVVSRNCTVAAEGENCFDSMYEGGQSCEMHVYWCKKCEGTCPDEEIEDKCPDDPNKTEPGECGCGVVDRPEGGCIVCGNGDVDTGEECDLGDQNGVENSGCDSKCKSVSIVTCGDGKVEGDEQCDEGENNVRASATTEFNTQANERGSPFDVDQQVITELKKSGCLDTCTFAQCSDTDDNDTDQTADKTDAGCHTCSTCFMMDPENEGGGPNYLPGKNDETHPCGEEITEDSQFAYEATNVTQAPIANLLAAIPGCKVKVPDSCDDFTSDQAANNWGNVLDGRYAAMFDSICNKCQWSACADGGDPLTAQDFPACPNGTRIPSPTVPGKTYDIQKAVEIVKGLARKIDIFLACPCKPTQENCGTKDGEAVCCGKNRCDLAYDEPCVKECYKDFKTAWAKCDGDDIDTKAKFDECRANAKKIKERCYKQCEKPGTAKCDRSTGGTSGTQGGDPEGCDIRFKPQCLCPQQPGCAAEFCLGNIWVCEDGNQCTQDYCNAGSGECVNKPWVVPIQGCSQGGTAGDTGTTSGGGDDDDDTSSKKSSKSSSSASSEEEDEDDDDGSDTAGGSSNSSSSETGDTGGEEDEDDGGDSSSESSISSFLAFSSFSFSLSEESSESSELEESSSSSSLSSLQISLSSFSFSSLLPDEDDDDIVSSSSSSLSFSSVITDNDEDDDDVASSSSSSLSSQIAAAFCGDGIIQPELGEDCDLGAANGPPGTESGCSCDPASPSCVSNIPGIIWSACRWPRCGDGLVNNEITLGNGVRVNFDIIREECDDGNTVSGDGCSELCQNELLLRSSSSESSAFDNDEDDGIEDDDGDGDNDDGTPDNDEDDIFIPTISSTSSETTSTSSETLVAAAKICGNGVLEPGEECDDSNRRDNDGCSSACLLEIGICGDGIVQRLLGEQCEQVSHDSSLPYGCRDCQFTFENCGDGTLDPGEECDDGEANSTSPDANCRPSCRLSRCGDGITDSSEQCDDGNRISGDGCDRFCQNEESPTTLVASENTDIPFTTQAPNNSPFNAQFPNQPNAQVLPFQLPLAQLRPLIQTQAPVGDTGPAAVAVIGAGAAAGFGWVRRRHK